MIGLSRVGRWARPVAELTNLVYFAISSLQLEGNTRASLIMKLVLIVLGKNLGVVFPRGHGVKNIRSAEIKAYDEFAVTTFLIAYAQK